VLCQVVKDPIGQKGARVTGYLSLPGRYSVFMPHVAQVGVSRRIGSDKERRRLRDLVNEVRPKGSGFIVRTAAEDAGDQELRDDVDFLARLWGEIDKRQDQMSGAGLVYADLDLSLRVVRDLMREDTSEVVIDDEDFFGALPRLIWHEDEPIAHPSSVPLHFVSMLAREHVKVVLTGEGADELLAGYGKYPRALFNWRAGGIYERLVPSLIRSAVADTVVTRLPGRLGSTRAARSSPCRGRPTQCSSTTSPASRCVSSACCLATTTVGIHTVRRSPTSAA